MRTVTTLVEEGSLGLLWQRTLKLRNPCSRCVEEPGDTTGIANAVQQERTCAVVFLVIAWYCPGLCLLATSTVRRSNEAACLGLYTEIFSVYPAAGRSTTIATPNAMLLATLCKKFRETLERLRSEAELNSCSNKAPRVDASFVEVVGIKSD